MISLVLVKAHTIDTFSSISLPMYPAICKTISSRCSASTTSISIRSTSVIRLGRQIIAWGKSDGVYMLDILNNFNLINPQIFNEQQIKIPEWAANIVWQPTATGELQGVFIPQYLPTYYTGLQQKGGFPWNGSYGDFTYGSISTD